MMQSEEELLKIALGLLDTHKYQKAVEFFTRVTDLNPANAEACLSRAIARFKLYETDAALNDVDQALTIDPDGHEAWFIKGEILRFL